MRAEKRRLSVRFGLEVFSLRIDSGNTQFTTTDQPEGIASNSVTAWARQPGQKSHLQLQEVWQQGPV